MGLGDVGVQKMDLYAADGSSRSTNGLGIPAEALSPPVVRRRYVLCFTDRRCWDIGRGVHFVGSARVHGLLNLAPSLVPGRERGVVVVSEFPAAMANLMLTDSISL